MTAQSICGLAAACVPYLISVHLLYIVLLSIFLHCSNFVYFFRLFSVGRANKEAKGRKVIKEIEDHGYVLTLPDLVYCTHSHARL